MLEHVDWQDVLNRYRSTGNSHVIIDNFIAEQNAMRLQQELLQNQMWRIKNPVSKHLHNSMPITPSSSTIVPELEKAIKNVFSESYVLAEYWALLYSKNTDGNIHADFGDLTITYWLTPDQYNLDESTGGLILYDVKRPPDMPFSDYLASGEQSRAYVAEHSRVDPIVIPYRFNRAILFNPAIFHKSNKPNFDLSHPSRMRMNMTFSFRDPDETLRQLELMQ